MWWVRMVMLMRLLVGALEVVVSFDGHIATLCHLTKARKFSAVYAHVICHG